MRLFLLCDSGVPSYKGEKNNKQLDREDTQQSRTSVVNIEA